MNNIKNSKFNFLGLLIIIILLNVSLYSFIYTNITAPQNYTFAKTQYYARVKEQNSYLYQTANIDESVENKYFVLPTTYFVKILNNYNETFYKAQYNDIVGYVKKDSVNLVNETPKTPHPTTKNLTTKLNTSCYVRTSPKIKTTFNNVITTIPANSSNIQYYGKILGDDAIDMQGNIWYYVKYNNNFGYVYSYYITTIINEDINTEKVSLRQNFSDVQLNPLTNPQSIILISLISLPLLIIMVLMYKPHLYNPKPKKVKYKQTFDTSKDIDFYNDKNLK